VTRRHPLLLLVTVAALYAWAVAPALAAGSSGPPRWLITSVSGPTNFASSGTGDQYVVTATNVGGEATSGLVTIEDSLPVTGVAATAIDDSSSTGSGEAFKQEPLSCSAPPLTSTLKCTYAGEVQPGDSLRFTVPVNVTAPLGAVLQSAVTVSGGNAESSSTSESKQLTAEPAPFGIASFSTVASTTQAGAHPDFTTSFTLNRSAGETPVADPRDVHVGLPPGLTGNPMAIPRCDIDDVRRTLCPADTAVGVATVHTEFARYVVLVYNIVPYPDEPAAFAFQIAGGTATARLDASLVPNSDGEYAVQVSVPEVNESEPVLESSVTLWGVPAEVNGAGPDDAEERAKTSEDVKFGGPGGEAALEKPFVRNPTACAGALESGLEVDSWQEPGSLNPAGAPEESDPRWKTAASRIGAPAPPEGFTGCGLISPLFTPSLAVAANPSQAGAPAGYEVALEVPQSDSAQTLASPDLRNAVVTLPAGTVASPSAANGLQTCSDAQLGEGSTEPAACPTESQIGTVKIKTPLLAEELMGQVFLGEAQCSPCGGAEAAEGRMLRPFIQVQGSGVLIKLAGRTEINQQTGQLTTTFQNTPQQPFEKLTLNIDGGPNAPLANPSTCGTATTTSQLSPWSSTPTEPFTAEPSSSFLLEGCATPQFSPSFSAGMTGSAQAGAYSPFSVTFSRTDADEDLNGITVQMPPGLLGDVSHVARCPDAQANAGECPQASEIGTVTAGVGPGSAPYYVTGGRAYLTGPYAGGPFGLSIVVPAQAGPFTLAGTNGRGEVVVRAAIHVDPSTAALTITSDPLPTALAGIPLQVKTVQVDVNRPQLMFNATNCDAMSIGAGISSVQGAQSAPSSPYEAVNCRMLKFKPSLTVSTQANTSKANGASLDVKVAQKAGEANMRKVDVSLPLALPTRLTTLQKACTEGQFAANPAGCPAASNVGSATARTPALDSPLTGPAYLVSHGGAAFPDLVVVLQGEGITIDLLGHTDIKKGITYSKFETVPDAPISSFELNLPEGAHSVLAANGDLCDQLLTMPATIVGQNGAQILERTKIAVTGCKPSLSLVKERLSGGDVLLTLRTSGGGLTVTGAGLKQAKKKLAVGEHQIRVRMTKAGSADHNHHTKIRIKASLRVGSKTVTRTATFRP